MTGAHRVGRILIAVAVTMLVVYAAPMLNNAEAGAQQSTASAASGYTPCEPGQKDIDLLVMMDASGSLNAPASGIDSDGRLRRTALEKFREELASLLQRLPEDDAGRIRISLWRFESGVKEIAGFEEASLTYPSDNQIEASLGEPLGNGGYRYRSNHTDYLRALGEVEEAFLSQGEPGACRVLLFFTDGLYDPTGNPSFEQAEELRREVCGAVKESFERAGIDTFAILVGQAFRDAADGSALSYDEAAIRSEMAEASKQALRALTGDADSLLVRGLPQSLGFDCERWSDEQPQDRDGSIIAVDDLNSLAIQLLEAAETAARQLVEWTNCGITPGLDGRSAPLPAGRYTETIVAYPRGSSIDTYEIVTTDRVSRSEPGSGERPLYLEYEDLKGLEAGWTLAFNTSGGSGGIEVACYYRTAANSTDESVGRLLDSDGEPFDKEWKYSPDGPDSPPLDGLRIEAEAPLGLCDHSSELWPDPRVQDWYCRSDGTVVIELPPLECGETLDLDRPLEFTYVAPHSEDLFGADGLEQQVLIKIPDQNRFLYDCLGAPHLYCEGVASQINQESYELPSERLRGISNCYLIPPKKVGYVVVTADWRPDSADLPGDLDWRFEGDHHNDERTGLLDETGRELKLHADDATEGVQLHFATANELVNADWRIAGVIELQPTWVTGITDDDEFNEEASEHMAMQRVEVRVDADYAARSDSGLARWLTLLLLLATLLLSYLLFCLALSSTFSLPNPGRFWWRHVVLGVERAGRSGYSFADDPAIALNSAPGESIASDRVGRSRKRPRYKSWRGPTPQPGAGNISVDLKRSPRFWLIGLLRGPWSEVRLTQGQTVAVSPAVPNRHRSSTQVASRAQFSRLMVVGSPRQQGPDNLSAPVWIALPRSGRSSLLEPADSRELSSLLNETTSRVDRANNDSLGEVSINAGDSEVGGGGADATGDETASETSDGPPLRRRSTE